MEEQSDTIMEEKEELMVSLSGENPTLRPARFLKPSLTSADGPAFELPLSAFCSSHKNLPDLRSNVEFKGCREPIRNWKKWVDRMESLHRSTWKRAGIYEPIITSTYYIRTNKGIILDFAERWCSATNTFVFPWGEATISLEDVMILGGYSVLGDSIMSPIETEELVQIDEKLMEARREINKTKSRKASQQAWMKLLMDTGSEIEHEAFLALWLSRHVFSYALDVVGKHVHKIAIHLARGTRIALGPAVLSSLYRDLRILKQAIVSSGKMKAVTEEKSLTLWSPMLLIQIWAWERFPGLQPQPNFIEDDEPRMARWNKVNASKVDNVRSAIDTSSESFKWRPYAIWEKSRRLHKFYKKKEKWVSVSPGMSKDLKSFVKFIRVSELVGISCIEQYFPHRVAMQFGMDQAIPGLVARLNETPEIAWENYTRPITDEKIYIPSRLFQSDVTTRYKEWWQPPEFVKTNVVHGNEGRKRIPDLSTIPLPGSKKKKVVIDETTSPNPPSKSKRVKAVKSVSKNKGVGKLKKSQKEMGINELRLARSNGNKIPDDGRSSRFAEPQISSSLPACNGAGVEIEFHAESRENTEISSSPPSCNGAGVEVEFHAGSRENTVISSSLPACNGAGVGVESHTAPRENTLCDEPVAEGSNRLFENLEEKSATIMGDNGAHINNEREANTQYKTKIRGMTLEGRISRLEILMAQLKEERLGLSKYSNIGQS